MPAVQFTDCGAAEVTVPVAPGPRKAGCIWSERASGESDILEEDGWRSRYGMYEYVLGETKICAISGTASTTLGESTILGGETVGAYEPEDQHTDGDSVYPICWRTGDMAYTFDGVDIGFDCPPRVLKIIDGEVWMSNGKERKQIRLISEVLCDPWFLNGRQSPLRVAARARSTIRTLLHSIVVGDIEITCDPENSGAVFFDQPLPYHPGYPVPKGTTVIESGVKEWWTDKVCATGDCISPGALCNQIIVPVEWECAEVVAARQEPPVLLGLCEMSKGRRDDIWSNMYEVARGVVGLKLPIYACAVDLEFEEDTTIYINMSIARAVENRGYTKHVVGVTPGIVYVESDVYSGVLGLSLATTPGILVRVLGVPAGVLEKEGIPGDWPSSSPPMETTSLDTRGVLLGPSEIIIENSI